MTEEVMSTHRFDQWLTNDSECAAVTMRQWLVSVEGEDAVIFPPTYAKPEGMRDSEWPGYNIDVFLDGTSVCQIDSVGSQANRIEPIFKRDGYRELVPRVLIRAGENGQHEVNLLDAGHRGADAIVRFSTLSSQLEKAFAALGKDGNGEPLAKIAPTSFVFGAWDSRVTQVKLPRIIRSVIRAFEVKPIHRSAQYIPPVEYIDEGLVGDAKSKTEQDSMSQLGLRHAPAPWTHGGILVNGEIRRDATLNLVALRTLTAGSEDRTVSLRRYILGLSLVCLTAPQDNSLREGCQLVPDTERSTEWTLVSYDGNREAFPLSHKDALSYARVAAEEFGVGEGMDGVFDSASARAALGQSKDERKRARRSKGKGTEAEGE